MEHVLLPYMFREGADNFMVEFIQLLPQTSRRKSHPLIKEVRKKNFNSLPSQSDRAQSRPNYRRRIRTRALFRSLYMQRGLEQGNNKGFGSGVKRAKNEA